MGAIAAMTMLAGCVGADIDALRTAEGTGDAFTRALTDEYRQFSTFEADDQYDWSAAGYFARKGLRAAAGEVVEPERLEDWKLPAGSVDELARARARLIELLDASARTKVPGLAAHAQGRFDCWVEQQEENFQADHIAACRDEFYKALAELEDAMRPAAPVPQAVPQAKPEPFIIYFAFDSAKLTKASEQIVANAVAAARKSGAEGFSVTGHADRAGSEAYNQKLSIRRANAVRDAMTALGANAGEISVAGRGESEPAVPTDDGVAEQANRRVVIILQ